MVCIQINHLGVAVRKLFFGLLMLFAVAIGGVAVGGVAHAAGPLVPDKNVKDVQLVVRAQLKAFAADDAKSAFSFATSDLQKMFGGAEQFMQMVRDSYPVVYRPASVTLYKPQPDGPAVMQRVALTDGQGNAWIAVYRLEQQTNKAWRIAGCVLMPDTGQRA